MSSAYLQLPLSESSKEFTTINTLKGLFQFNRFPLGIASAPAIFQRSMETLLRSIPGVSVHLDDILITGSSLEEHLKSLQEVLKRLCEAGCRLSKVKCFFLCKSIEYLGHIIDAQGLHPTENKTSAIKNAPRPTIATELRSFSTITVNFCPGCHQSLHPYTAYCASRHSGPGVNNRRKHLHCLSTLTQQSH